MKKTDTRILEALFNTHFANDIAQAGADEFVSEMMETIQDEFPEKDLSMIEARIQELVKMSIK